LRLALLTELADTLVKAEAAVLHTDLVVIRALTLRQSEICHAYRQVCDRPTEMAAATAESQPATLRAGEKRLTELKSAVIQTEQKVLQLNRRYHLLLQRVRRTSDIFCRALVSASLTYEPTIRNGSRGVQHV
jgi:hypothetical protein